MNYQIETFCDNLQNANTYLVYTCDSCVIVDPANNLKVLQKYIENRKIEGVLLTHGHYDHFKMLKDYSVRYQVCVPHNTKLRGVKYSEKLSSRVKNGNMWDIYMIYTPSHELNISEFAFLMNGLVQECEQQGIDTRSPYEYLEDD